jgi:hypothetical protein
MSKLFTDFREFEEEVELIINEREDLLYIKEDIRKALRMCFEKNDVYAYSEKHYPNLFGKLIICDNNKIPFEGIEFPIRNPRNILYCFVIHQTIIGSNFMYIIVTIDISNLCILAQYSNDLPSFG